MKNWKLLTLLLGLVIMSCGPRVNTEKLTDRDLREAYDTFAYLPNATPDVDGEAVDDPVVNQSIIETINSNMERAGFNLDREDPDLLVLVTMETQTETRTSVTPRYAMYPYAGRVTSVHPVYNRYYYSGFQNWFGPDPFMGYDAHTRGYKTGTLIVYLVDRETRRTVWRGTASDALSGNTPQAAEELINEMFEEFP